MKPFKGPKAQRGFIGAGAAILGGSILGAGGSYLAAREQSKSADRATELQKQMYQQTRADLAPYRETGGLALSDLATRMGLSSPGTPGTPATPGTGETWRQRLGSATPGTPGTPGIGNPNDPNFGQLTHQFNLQDFQESPAYQFNLQQGKLALDKASAARGKFYAPSTLQDIAKFSQGMASNEYQNAYSNYNSNMQNIFNRLYSLSGSGQNAAAQTGAFGTNAANQAGQNTIGAGNATAAGIVGGTNALVGGANNYANNQILQQILARNQGSTVGGDIGGGFGAQAGVS